MVDELDKGMVITCAFICLCLSALIFVCLLLGWYISYYIGLTGITQNVVAFVLTFVFTYISYIIILLYPY